MLWLLVRHLTRASAHRGSLFYFVLPLIHHVELPNLWVAGLWLPEWVREEGEEETMKTNTGAVGAEGTAISAGKAEEGMEEEAVGPEVAMREEASRDPV